MKYTINPNTKAPAYLQLYMQVRDDIINGVYPLGSKLPSKRLICSETGVSTITAEHAYALLCDEGYAEAKERSGYFVIFRTDDGFAGIQQAAHQPTPGAHHHTYISTEFPFSVLAKAMRKVITDSGNSILERPEPLGCPQLREAIQLYLARSRGIWVKSEQIIIGSGSEYLYTVLAELFGRGKTYAIESPSYKKIENVYTAFGIKTEKLPLGNDGIDSAALKKSKADILHISPYRSFPSGVTATASKRHEYLRWAQNNSSFIIEDDFESEFSVSKKHEETLFSLSAMENVIYMNSFSKTISPSFRVAYMVLPEAVLEKYKADLGFYSCTVPTYMQLVIAELITSGAFERHINRIRREKRKQLQQNPI